MKQNNPKNDTERESNHENKHSNDKYWKRRKVILARGEIQLPSLVMRSVSWLRFFPILSAVHGLPVCNAVKDETYQPRSTLCSLRTSEKPAGLPAP